MRNFQLTEYELNDIAELLATIPTKTDVLEKEAIEDCPECKNPVCVVYDQENERVDTADREFIYGLVERIGEIYDKARVREVVGAVDYV